jgi:hypothetical protein
MSEGFGPLGERWDDDVLGPQVAAALVDVRPYLDQVAARGRSAFTWLTVDDDLLTAQLSFDSARAVEPVLVRDAVDGNRVLVFGTDLRTVEIEVLTDRVVGQFLPPSAGHVEVETDDGVADRVEVDDLGFFVVEPVPGGRFRLHCTTPTTRLVTEWVVL